MAVAIYVISYIKQQFWEKHFCPSYTASAIDSLRLDFSLLELIKPAFMHCV